MPSQQLLSEFKIDACKLQVDFPGFDSKEHPLVKVVAIFYVECHQSSILYLENAFRGGVSGREVSRREMQKKKVKEEDYTTCLIASSRFLLSKTSESTSR